MTLDIKARAKGARHLPAGARGLHARLRWALRNPQLHLGIIVLVPTLLWYVVLQAGPVLEAFWFALYHVELTSLRSWKIGRAHV